MDPDLVRALCDEECEHAVEADGGQRQRHRSENHEEKHTESFARGEPRVSPFKSRSTLQRTFTRSRSWSPR